MSFGLAYLLFYRQGFGFAMALLTYALLILARTAGLTNGIMPELILSLGILALPLSAQLVGSYLDLANARSKNFEILLVALAAFALLQTDYINKLLAFIFAISSGQVFLASAYLGLVAAKLIVYALSVVFVFYALIIAVEIPFYWFASTCSFPFKVNLIRPMLIVFSLALTMQLLFQAALRFLIDN